MLYVNNLKKGFLVVLLLSSFTHAGGLLDKPFPICTNIKSYMAYEMATVVKQRCDPNGVVMSVKDLHKIFLPMMTDEYASVGDCNKDCFLLQATDNINMGDCVKSNLIKPFVNTAMNSGSYNKKTCIDMQSRIK